MPIKNRDTLLKESVEKRPLVLDTIEYILNIADPRNIIKESIKLIDAKLVIKNIEVPLDFDSIYIIGAGKASGYMAEALYAILGNSIRSGFVIIPDYLEKQEVGDIKLWRATHPIPSKKGLEGVKRMLRLVESADNDDLVICLISGGCSSLMPMPYDGITLIEKQDLTSSLLKSGATIEEINTVRKHISNIKGGRLAARLNTNIISLIISDVINNRLDMIGSGPTSPDPTTYHDAKSVLEKYNLYDKFPSVRRVIEDGINNKIPETPKPNDPIFDRVKNIILADNNSLCTTAMNYLSNYIDTKILTTTLQGEAKDVGLILGSIINEIGTYDRPFNKPIALIAGGETVVTLHGNGIGGRNQELLLSALRVINYNRYVMASISTDGIEGNSDAAGAIIDNSTTLKSIKNNLNIERYLSNNDSNTFFKILEDIIYTGPTGTNLNDIVIIVIY